MAAIIRDIVGLIVGKIKWQDHAVVVEAPSWKCHLSYSHKSERKSENVSRSVVSNSLRPHGLYVACQIPPSIGFSRQEFWSGLPFPSPGDLPWPRDRTPVSRIVCRRVTIWATREACISYVQIILMAPTSHSNSPYSTCQEISVKILPAAEYIYSNYAFRTGEITKDRFMTHYEMDLS